MRKKFSLLIFFKDSVFGSGFYEVVLGFALSLHCYQLLFISQMEGAGGDNFQDWEVLPNSDSESDSALVNSPDRAAAAVEEEIDDGDYAEGMIRSDYFSLDNQNRYVKTDVVSEEEGSIESDNPSWIDPGSETRYPVKNSGEFWSDSGSDRSDERKLGEFQVGSLRMGGFDGGVEKGTDMSSSVVVVVDDHVKNQEEESEIACGGSDDEEGKIVNSSGGEGERRAVSKAVGGEGRIVWWKVPFEVLKYCVSKVNPVWSLSVAAAVVGLVILGRKLYRMKRKTRSLQLKVALDDKKVSQFMSRAARLNEAFSVVRRVPIVRPALPAPGVNSWPVMSMR